MRTKTTFKKGHAPTYTKTGKDHFQYKHGQGSITSRSNLYQKWCAMKRRCFNKNEKCYKNWGGRGITVCKEWLSFENFARDMAPTFKQGLSLDRIDVNGNYEPSNCRWVTLAEQNRNKRSTNTQLVVNRHIANIQSKLSHRYDAPADWQRGFEAGIHAALNTLQGRDAIATKTTSPSRAMSA